MCFLSAQRPVTASVSSSRDGRSSDSQDFNVLPVCTACSTTASAASSGWQIIRTSGASPALHTACSTTASVSSSRMADHPDSVSSILPIAHSMSFNNSKCQPGAGWQIIRLGELNVFLSAQQACSTVSGAGAGWRRSDLVSLIKSLHSMFSNSKRQPEQDGRSSDLVSSASCPHAQQQEAPASGAGW
jgi:hypothetical protein